MRDNRRNLPANDFDRDGRKISSDSDFLKEKKWLILKLLIVIIPGILYWATSDDNFEKKVSFNLSMDAGVSSNESVPPPAPPVQNSQNNIELSNQKYNEGVVAFNRKDYTTAVNFYTQAIELNPNHAFAYHNRGLTYQNLQNFQQALADLNKAIQLDAYNANFYDTRGALFISS